MKRFAIALLLPLLVACGASEGGVQTPSDTGQDGKPVKKIAVDDLTDLYLVEFTLSDGTRCVYVDGDGGGGPDCDWQ